MCSSEKLEEFNRMAVLHTYSYTENDIQANANAALACTLAGLTREGILTEEQANDIASNYVIIINKKGFFTKLWEKATGIQDDMAFIMVRRV